MKEIWIVEGFGDGNPEKHTIEDDETVGDLKRQYARKFGVRREEIDVSTETKRLTNESSRLANVVDDGETINVIPRGKAGWGWL